MALIHDLCKDMVGGSKWRSLKEKIGHAHPMGGLIKRDLISANSGMQAVEMNPKVVSHNCLPEIT